MYCTCPLIVRWLRTRFEKDVDIPDKSITFFSHATHYISFHFLIGATSSRYRMAAILDFQNGHHVKTYKYQYLVFQAT